MSRILRRPPAVTAAAALLLAVTGCAGAAGPDPAGAPATPSRPPAEPTASTTGRPAPAGRVRATVSVPARVRAGETVALRLGVSNPGSTPIRVAGGACHPRLGVVITTPEGEVVREPAADDPCPNRDLVVPAGGTSVELPLQATWNVCTTAAAPRPGAVPCPPERSIPRLPAGSYLVTVRSDTVSVLEPARITVVAADTATGTTSSGPPPGGDPAGTGASG